MTFRSLFLHLVTWLKADRFRFKGGLMQVTFFVIFLFVVYYERAKCKSLWCFHCKAAYHIVPLAGWIYAQQKCSHRFKPSGFIIKWV